MENLLKRALEDDALPFINPLVDLYNLVSLERLVPVGEAQLRAALADLSELVRHFCGAQTQAHVLDRARSSVSLV